MITLGLVVRPHGLKGAIKIQYYGSDPQSMLEYKVQMGGSDLKIISVFNVRKGYCCIECDRANSYESADLLRGEKIMISRDELPELGADEYYWEDLRGCRVFRDGVEIGEVTKIFSTVGGDVAEITHAGKTSMFLLDENSIKEIDIEGKSIAVNHIIS